jgi:hypothetical protein
MVFLATWLRSALLVGAAFTGVLALLHADAGHPPAATGFGFGCAASAVAPPHPHTHHQREEVNS